VKAARVNSMRGKSIGVFRRVPWVNSFRVMEIAKAKYISNSPVNSAKEAICRGKGRYLRKMVSKGVKITRKRIIQYGRLIINHVVRIPAIRTKMMLVAKAGL
jgi:hypothetical protein